jgi:hypothetical protein
MTSQHQPHGNAVFCAIRPGLLLLAPSPDGADSGYPTDCVGKGLTLEANGTDLAEEGVGFGVPIIKQGLQAVFPGPARVVLRDPGRQYLQVEYLMHLRERLALRGSSVLQSRPANFLKEIGGVLHRAYPRVRGGLNAVSRLARNAFGIRSVFEPGPCVGAVRLEYQFDPAGHEVRMTMDASGVLGPHLSEVILMNEQGANHFDLYSDADGCRLCGPDIGTWVPVTAAEARLSDPAHCVSFSVQKEPGCRLYRGRELAPGRLAWAGFAYRVPPGTRVFSCSVRIGDAS